MPRFFIDESDISGLTAALRDVAHVKALRLRAGEGVTLCDGRGTDYTCRVTTVDRDCAYAEIISAAPNETEPETELRVFLAYAKGERLETAVRMCTELGARSFTLFPSEHVVALPDKKSLPVKLARLQSIARSAAEQSGRGIIPSVTAAPSFTEAVALAADVELPIFPYENERKHTLSDLLRENARFRTASVMTGAEGGFTPDEASYAQSRGMRPVTLGRLILRCDTAPIAVAAAVFGLTAV